MGKFPLFRRTEWTMKRKLFGYMLLLAALLLIALLTGLVFFGRFDSARQKIYKSLDIQLEVFEKDIVTHFDHLSAAGIQLSDDMTFLIEEHLQKESLSFSELTDSPSAIGSLEQAMIEPMRQKLLQEDCSGIFVMLDTTINSTLENAENSRAGIYLQVSGYETAYKSLLLYRGSAEIGKQYGIMPHRKWRLEMQTDFFPDYEKLLTLNSSPPETAYIYTDLFTLPGTSEQAMLLVLPIRGSDGSYYGLCGFEISESFFMTLHAQPSRIDHLTFLIAPVSETDLAASAALSCGITTGYYRAPKDSLRYTETAGGLLAYKGKRDRFIGLQKPVTLSPNMPDRMLVVLMPRSDYDLAVRHDLMQNIILWMLLIFFTVTCCLYLSRRFLTPILLDLEQIKQKEAGEPDFHLPEISDLFAYLEEKDREYEASLATLNRETEEARIEVDRIRKEYADARQKYEKAQAEISRLAYARKQEIDPDDYRRFCAGLGTLTATEQKIFRYYLDGKTVKEIIAIAGIKESTLRYHNQNIYSKLGVNSLKQLLRYAALMKESEN